MKFIKKVTQSEVFAYWEVTEKINITLRFELLFPIIVYNNLVWHLAKIEEKDIDKIYICSSDDWESDGLCKPDFKLTTALRNYEKGNSLSDKSINIKKKQDIFKYDIEKIDRKFVYVADTENGRFTIIEGCKRSVALAGIGKLVGNEIFIGISPYIKNYHWARYTYNNEIR